MSTTDPTAEALAAWPDILRFRERAMREGVWNYFFSSFTAPKPEPTKEIRLIGIRFGRSGNTGAKKNGVSIYVVSITGPEAFDQVAKNVRTIGEAEMNFLNWVCKSFMQPVPVDDPPLSGREKSTIENFNPHGE